MVVALPVAVGDEVEVGATLVVLEAMKMETAVRAPSAGRVREVYAVVNSQVDAGAALLRFDPLGESTAACYEFGSVANRGTWTRTRARRRWRASASCVP